MRRGQILSAAQGSAVLGAALLLSAGRASAEGSVSYRAALERALVCLEAGQTREAVAPLRQALSIDRNEPLGLLTLAALRLQSGDSSGARHAVERAGPAVQSLSGGPAEETILTLYRRLLAGDAAGAATALAEVDEDEPSALRLEVAAIAAARAGDSERGERLLDAFLKRPEGQGLAEPAGAVLTFVASKPLQGTGAPLLENGPFLEPAGSVLVGATVLSMGALPRGVATVSYTIAGANFRALTNTAPFESVWETRRTPNGEYTVEAIAYDSAAREVTRKHWIVRVANAESGRSAHSPLSPDAQAALRPRIAALLRPHPGRAAAHYERSVLAVRRGDAALALAEMENVCAIDPFYRAANESLRRFNQEHVTEGIAYWRGETKSKLIALTFDDGPNALPYKTPALLDALRNNAVPATFFIVGQQAQAAPELIKRMVEAGHEVANHSYSHRNLTYLEPADVWRELCRASVIIRDLTGRRARFYRPPGGNFNGATGKAAAALGMDGAYWTVDAFSYEKAPFTPAQLTDFVVKKARPGAIILLHNAPPNTIAALPAIAARLRAQGYTLVTLRELIRRSAAEKATAPQTL